jgi:hypothetical protein
VQVLQESYVQATRPTREDRLTHAQARDLVESFTRFEAQPITVEVVRALGCAAVLSEDLQHGGDYDGVVAEDPFR